MANMWSHRSALPSFALQQAWRGSVLGRAETASRDKGITKKGASQLVDAGCEKEYDNVVK